MGVFLDITWFPFDDQKCDLKFGSWTFSALEVGEHLLQTELNGIIAEFGQNFIQKVL